MYSREEASNIRKEFWTTYGQYMAPVPSAEGRRINWINYKTGIKNIQFKMTVHDKQAIVGIYMLHDDVDMQELFYEQFLQIKPIVNRYLGENWEWQLHEQQDNKIVSRIFLQLSGVSILNREHWPELISFFKSNMIKLDAFWAEGSMAFDELI